MKSTVTSKGQVTIPKSIRNQAHIHSGTIIDFQIEDDGTILIRPLTNELSKLKGIVKTKRRRPVSLKAMKSAIQKAAAENMT